ncbi:MAG: glycoside hydrolase [Devosia sp.]|nr:glycoside hydrolase [Devosia sp.]
MLLSIQGVWAQDWPALRETSLEIDAGSPLDFSVILPNGAIDAQRHLTLADGRFAFSDTPGVSASLHCASLAWSPASGGFPDHASADRYVTQLVRHGYNLARFHYVEAALMLGSSADFAFDPETLDRFHYLLAALKRAGISWVMDGLTSNRGGLAGYDDDRGDVVGPLKQEILLSAEGMAHWRRLQDLILGTVNPYTGLAPIADPALALVVLVNEGALEFDGIVAEGRGEPAYSELVRSRFNAFLRSRYVDSAALAAAWGGLGPDESLEAGTIAMPTNRWGRDPRFVDLQLFFTQVEQAGTQTMSAHLRAMGYHGAISNYNNWPTLQISRSRAGLDVVTMNTYFDWVGGYQPGTRIEQGSSISRELDYLRLAASTRFLGKPFVLTEYDHLFWNRHRYEAGLAVPAFAAFQGWDAICRHGHGPLILRYGEDFPHKRQMLPYAIALDPVARAGETLAALLFRRGDVKASGVQIAFPLDLAARPGPAINQREPEAATALSIFGAIGLTGNADRAATALPVSRDGLGMDALAAPMLAAGLISDSQWALAGRGIYRSDTGELTVVPGAALIEVETPRTVAAAFSRLDQPLQLGPVTIADPSGPSLVALSALDGALLGQSRRILVIFASDAHNTDMRFADLGEREIVDFGRLPVRVRPASLSLQLAGEGMWTLSPVGLDGVVHPPVGAGEGALVWRLDNIAPSGPTTYFVIERG